MIFRRLALRDFRRFAAYETTFAPGLNLVLGDNEAGKSTLREAIAAALFHNPKTSKSDVLGQKRWGAAEQFCVALEYEAGGEVWLLTKDFQKKTARLENRTTGAVLTDVRAIEGQVGAALGLTSKALFESTVRVTQRDLTKLQDPGGIADTLQQVMTGGADDARASDVLKKLDDASKALKSAGRVNPGPLSTLPGEIATMERTLGTKRADLERAVTDRRDLSETQGELEMVESDLGKKQAILEDVAERLKLESQQIDAENSERKLADRLDAIGRLQQQIAAGEAKREQYDLVLSLSETRVGEFSSLEQQANVHTESVPSFARPAQVGPRVSVLVLGAVAGLVGIIGGLNQPVLFVLLAVGAGIIAWELWRARGTEAEPARAAAALYAQRQREDAERASSRLQALLAEVGCQSAADLHGKRRQGLDLQDGLSRQRGQLEGLFAGETGEEIEAKRRQASDTARWLRDQLAATRLQLAKMDQLAYLRLDAEVRSLQGQRDTLSQKVDNLKFEVRVNLVNLDEVYSLEEELQDLRRRLAEAEERQQVLTLARSVMAAARQATMVTAKDVLESDMGGLVSEITHGRYGGVKVEPGTLDIRLCSPECSEGVRVSLDGDLSTGTVEQVYLAARLALAKLLSDGKRPPLLLDDPFVTFDGPRTAAVLGLLRRLSAESQVLLFTCHPDYQSVADHCVQLPPATVATLASAAPLPYTVPTVAEAG